MDSLTNDAYKVMCCIYKKYLERRKAGESKINAVEFEPDFYLSIKELSGWQSDDISAALHELHDEGFVSYKVTGDVELLNKAISYMEHRIKNSALDVADFLTKLIP